MSCISSAIVCLDRTVEVGNGDRLNGCDMRLSVHDLERTSHD